MATTKRTAKPTPTDPDAQLAKAVTSRRDLRNEADALAEEILDLVTPKLLALGLDRSAASLSIRPLLPEVADSRDVVISVRITGDALHFRPQDPRNGDEFPLIGEAGAEVWVNEDGVGTVQNR